MSEFFHRSAASPRSDGVTLDLPGIEGQFAYDGNTDTLAATEWGLGDSTSKVTHGDSTLFSVDVNADAGRHVDFNVRADQTQRLVIDTKTPVNVRLEYALATVGPLVPSLQSFALDDTVQVELEGAKGIALLEEQLGTVNLLRGMRGHLLFLGEGQVALRSRIQPENNVTLLPGQCLFRDPVTVPGRHAILGPLSERDCR